MYAHQKAIIDADPKKCGLFLGTGSGKTFIALLLARSRTLVICPKTQKEDQNWQRERTKIPNGGKITKFTVVSKEEFRRDWTMLGAYDTVIVDEAHTCLGVTPNTRSRRRVRIPKTSQLFEALQEYLVLHKPIRVYLCTATIMRSPMTVWGAAKVIGTDIDFYDFREQFYTRLPMPFREVYAPRSDNRSKDALAKIVHSLGHVGRLEDYFDVPEQTWRTDYIETTAKQKAALKALPLDYPDPLVCIGKKHQVENGVLAGDEFSKPQFFENGKLDRLLDYADEFPRIVVFAKYRAQISQIEAALRKAGKNVLTLTGDTKERGAVILSACKAKECVFLCQAQISAGWELKEYPVMIFVSRTNSFVDYVQAQGRIQRADNIKKNLYIKLVVRSGVDQAVDKSLDNKQDFDERLHLGIK